MAVQLNFTPQTAFSQGVYAGGAKASFFESGTTTPIDTYTAIDLVTPNPVPLVADSYGVFPQVFTDGSVEVKAVITTSADAAIVTIDPVIRGLGEGSGANDITFTPVTGNTATDVQEAISNNTASIVGLGTASAEDFTDDDDLTVDPDNVGTRGNAKAYADSAASGIVTSGNMSPTVNTSSGFTPGGSASISGTYRAVNSFRTSYVLAFNMDTSESIAVGDRLDVDDSSLPVGPSAYLYDHAGTFSVFTQNSVTISIPVNIASGVVTVVRGNGVERMYLTVTSVVGSPTWDMDGEARLLI